MTARGRRLLLAAALGLASLAALALVAWRALEDVPPRLLRHALWRVPERSGKDLLLVVDLEDEAAWVSPWKALARAALDDAEADVVVLPVADFTAERVAALEPRAVLVSGFLERSPRKTAGLAALHRFVERTELPVLGTCGGHQAIAEAHGARVAMRGRQERGLVTIARDFASDPLLDGLGRTFEAFAWHRMEVVELPDGLVVLAGNEACPVQAFAARGRPVYGVQFHPELTPESAGGRLVLRNFLALAGFRLR